MTVAVINAGGANLGSVVYALERLGAEVAVTQDAGRIRSAERVILPGVGAARPAMQALEAAGLVETIRSLSQPVLGICLGLQLLFERSEEDDTACLGILPGRVTRLVARPGLRLPHMGWNRLKIRSADPLLRGIDAGDWFYFVHGYAACLSVNGPVCRTNGTGRRRQAPIENAVATSRHGDSFAAVVRQENVAACQFHPERSAAAGARILGNFLEPS